MDKKTLAGAGVGILIGKLGGSLAWWALGATAAVLIAKSPGFRKKLGAGARRSYHYIRS